MNGDAAAVHTGADRDFWRAVLTAGATVVPRWASAPVVGVAEHVTTVPVDVIEGVGRLADAMSVSAASVLLATHAKVVAALCGEPEVVIGSVAVPGGPPLPCRLTTRPATWRSLLQEAHRAELELRSHAKFPVDRLRAELGLTGPAFEILLDPADGEADGDEPLGPGVVLSMGFDLGRGQLRVRHRTDALAGDAAARIAGYHLTALTQLIADPDAVHARQSLLSEAEVRFQLDGLAGPRRPVPNRRFHELFEERAGRHPDAIAAVHGGRTWTYGQLNSRANQVARALLARGLRREDPVAVVTERNLDWMTCVVGVLKAGGAYLPIEPHFPPERIATTLTRAGCGTALSELGSTAMLDQALVRVPRVSKLLVGDVYREEHPDADLHVEVAADQLAYIYFTSGSTGEPKGAMCEHAGLLNHLFAKVDDLRIGPGQVVAQTAPQCFDISLWQLVSALLVGGRTLIVGQDVVLDVERFVATLVEGRVAVLQVVPSYLEAVLTYLERHPRALPDLRYVSVTGEALKRELVVRWFAVQPGIRLVNAYGLTETSDDTNHEVMDRPPAAARVPIGRPVNNVHVSVVDEHLALVPLGAPGEIVFSGVCVGRGYVNDPERTAAAYGWDPLRPGNRRYRGGDFGRWLPSGSLEYLGRRDSQVKVAGFRIELGEVENALLRVPGVRDGAVVVAGGPDRSPQLVAFYLAPAEVGTDQLRDRLGATLPAYMVPTAFHRRERLPLTPNGKVDRKALAVVAAELEAGVTGSPPPDSPSERRMAAAWAAVLGVPPDQVGRRDHFFDRGGTSLSAVRLAIALDRSVSVKDVTANPVLCDLAALVDLRSARRDPPSTADGPRRAAGLSNRPDQGRKEKV